MKSILFAMIIGFPMLASVEAQTNPIPDVSSLDPDKYTVCTITINSSEEKEVFKSKLPKDKFQFVELLDFGNDLDPKMSSSEEWLNQACQSGVHCHMLVVSGHFGGTFFGSSGKTMSSSQMERLSCSKTCSGIFNAPKEAFLFGCNTLAGKEKDSRTPEQYLQVLLEDRDYLNVPRATLESIVEARYGAFGSEFRDVMGRSFDGVPNIYGFNSIGPSGKNVEKYLKDYFEKVGDYGAYYKKKFGPPSSATPGTEVFNKTLKQQLDALSKTSLFNPEIQDALKITNFTQCNGLLPSDPNYADKDKICKLYDQGMSSLERMKLIVELVKDKKRLAYFPMIQDVLSTQYEISDLMHSDCEECRLFQGLISDEKLKTELITAIQAVDVPSLKSDWLIFAKKVGWMDDQAFALEAKKIILGLAKEPITRGNVDTLYDLPAEIILSVKISPSDLPASIAQTELGVELLSQMAALIDLNLTPYIPTLTSQFFNFSGNPNSDYFYALEGLITNAKTQGYLNTPELEAEAVKKGEKVIEFWSARDEALHKVYVHYLAMNPDKYAKKIEEIIVTPELDAAYYFAAVSSQKGEPQLRSVKLLLDNMEKASPERKIELTRVGLYSLGPQSKDLIVSRVLNEKTDVSLLLVKELWEMTGTSGHTTQELNRIVIQKYLELKRKDSSRTQIEEAVHGALTRMFGEFGSKDFYPYGSECAPLPLLVEHQTELKIDLSPALALCSDKEGAIYSIFERDPSKLKSLPMDLLLKSKKLTKLLLEHPEAGDEELQLEVIKTKKLLPDQVLGYFEKIKDASPRVQGLYMKNESLSGSVPQSFFEAPVFDHGFVSAVIKKLGRCKTSDSSVFCDGSTLEKLRAKLERTPVIDDTGKVHPKEEFVAKLNEIPKS